jgi:hypothetical protein
MDWCLGDSPAEAAALAVPDRVRALLASQIDVLREMDARGETASLPAYSVVAERSESLRPPAS